MSAALQGAAAGSAGQVAPSHAAPAKPTTMKEVQTIVLGVMKEILKNGGKFVNKNDVFNLV